MKETEEPNTVLDNTHGLAAIQQFLVNGSYISLIYT